MISLALLLRPLRADDLHAGAAAAHADPLALLVIRALLLGHLDLAVAAEDGKFLVISFESSVPEKERPEQNKTDHDHDCDCDYDRGSSASARGLPPLLVADLEGEHTGFPE